MLSVSYFNIAVLLLSNTNFLAAVWLDNIKGSPHILGKYDCNDVRTSQF